MANEFIIKNGFISQGNSIVNATLSANTVQILTAPTLNNSNTQILSRNSSTGAIEYSVISGVTSDTYVTGFTYNDSNLLTISQNQGQPDLNVYLNNFSGLTVNGNSNLNTVTASSITNLNYITFNTGSTIVGTGTTVGTVYFDNTEKALSYNTSINQGVTVNLGQQNYIRVFNNSGADIQRGKALEVLTASNGLPAVTLAINKQNGSNIIGVSSEIIPNNKEGIAITYGIISNIELTGMTVGSLIYASDSIPGNLDDATKYFDFPLTARTNQIGYVVQTGLTTGKLFVAINNENTVLSLTDLQRNVLEGNVISTGVFDFHGIFLSTGNTFDVGYTQAFIIDNTSNPLRPDVLYVEFLGQSGLTTPYLTTDTESYVLLTSGGTISVQPTFPTPKERRTSVYLGKLGHGNKTSLINAFNEPDLDISPLSQVRDIFTPIKLINDGVVSSPNGVNLNFNTSAGYIWGLGINFVNEVLNPSRFTVTANSPVTFQYRTQTGGTASNTTLIDPTNYDLNGVITPVGSPAKQATNQRIFLLQNGQFRIQYGQHKYIDLPTAIVAAQNETFTTFSNFKDNAILIGVLSVRSDATDLSSTSEALFHFVSKFGELGGGTAGISTTTLQQAYNNSTSPEIVTNTTLDGVQFRGGTGNDADKNIIIENNSGVQTAWINADGTSTFTSVSATTYYGDGSNLTGIAANDYYVTGGTYSSGVLTLNRQNGSVAITGFSYTPNLITVALNGGTSDFTSIKDAMNSIIGATSVNPYTVKVGPGVYYENNPINLPSWVSLVGEDSISTIIQAVDPSQTLFYLGDQSAIFDCQIQGVTGTGISAIVYSSSTTPQSAAISYVENVRFGTNYTHAKVIGSGSANIIMQCSNVKYGGYPFTVGFEATNDGSPSAIGRMQLRNVTSTNGGVTSTTGLTFAKADKPNCGFIVNGCLLTKAQGSPAGTGFYVENGAFLRLTAVNFQRWLTGIYAPQIGSAPSIDAIALNFENCTTDVSIVHSGATGKIQGTDTFLKTNININAPLYEVNQDPREVIVAKKGGDFSSIKSAVDYLVLSATTSSDSRYVIQVGPGIFYEDEIDLTNTPYVSIVGSNIQTTEIYPNSSAQHIIKIGVNNEISFLTLNGAGPGYAGIYCYDIGDYAQAHKVSFYDCDTNVWVESNTQDTNFYGEYLDFNGSYSYGTKSIGNNNYVSLANMENYYNFPEGTGTTICNYTTGSGGTINIFVGDSVSNGVSGSTAFLIQNGSSLNASSITIDGFTYGIRNPLVGDPVRFDVDNASIVNGELDLSIERIGTFGTFAGSSSHEKIYTVSNDIYWNFLDIDDGELDITRKASVTFADGTHTDFTTLIFEGSTMGLMSGGEITVVSGFTVSTAAGFGYLSKSLTPEIYKRIDWDNSQIALGANENKYIYINENSILSSSGTRPSSVFNIVLGRVVTNSTDVSFIDLSPSHSDHTSNRFGNLFREAMGPIYASGSIVTENTTPFNLDVTGGEYYYSTSGYMPSGGTQVLFTQYYRDGLGDWITTATTVVNSTSYDGNGVLSALTSGYYTKHTLYVVGEGSYENYFLVLGQNEYSSLVAAENALLPTPPTFFTDSVSQVANIYIEQGASGITQVEDIRPVIGFKAGGVNASSVHGNLLGLSADDHTQYLLVSGGRAMSGNLDMGGNQITNVGNVDGVDVSAHALRHQYGNPDPVGTTTPSAYSIPYADINGKLDSWISTGTTTTFGLVRSLGPKASTVAGTSFTGNPKKYTVTFTTPYPNTNYSIFISGNINRTFTWETKTVNGFTINANSNTSFTENVDWSVMQHGES